MKKTRLLSLGLFVCLLVTGLWFEFFGPTTHNILANATALKVPKPLAAFQLQDTAGQAFTQNSLGQEWSLIFFGYRQCPDICPATLSILKETAERLPKKTAQKVRFIFVNLLPINDEPDKLKAFVAQFNPQFTGLTGSAEALKSFMKSLGAYADEVQTGSLEHSAHLFLLNPQGQLSAVISPPLLAPQLANDLVLLTR